MSKKRPRRSRQGPKKQIKAARISVARTHQEEISARCEELGVQCVESLINSHTPHWRFLQGSREVMHYWPSTNRWWMPSDSTKGFCEPHLVVDFLAAELHDLARPGNRKRHGQKSTCSSCGWGYYVRAGDKPQCPNLKCKNGKPQPAVAVNDYRQHIRS